MRSTLKLICALALLLSFAATGCASSQQAAGPVTPPATSTTPSTSAAPPTTQSVPPSPTPQPAPAVGSVQLGKQIFTTGKGADGSTIGTSAGRGGPCMRCHGTNAKGGAGPDIRWSVLTGAASSPKAPRFPLADEAEFETAVTTGNAAGNQLRPMMPHYRLTSAEAAALAAYLQTL